MKKEMSAHVESVLACMLIIELSHGGYSFMTVFMLWVTGTKR